MIILYITLATYLLGTLLDLFDARKEYSDHVFITFDDPSRSYWFFFRQSHKHTVYATLIAFVLGVVVYAIYTSIGV